MTGKVRTRISKNGGRHLVALLLFATFVNACAPNTAGARSVKPAARTSEVPSLPSPTAVPPTATEVSAATQPAYVSLATKPEVPPQTINGATATIDGIYADESRVAVQYTISGLDWPDNVQITSMSPPTMTSQAIPNIAFGAVGWGNSPTSAGKITGSMDQMLPANAVDVASTPVADVHLDIPLDGTGAFTSSTPSTPGEAPGNTPVDLPNVGVFHFDLQVPVYKAVKLLDINQTVEANGITVTLKSLILNRSHADALLCFQMPSAQDWSPSTTFKLNNGPSTDGMGAASSSLFLGDGKHFSLTDPERCVGVGSDISYDGGQTEVTVSIPKLKTSIPEVISEDLVERANERLADRGIAFEVNNEDHGSSFNILKRPDGMPDMELYPLIWDAMPDWYEGPWVFTVEVKP